LNTLYGYGISILLFIAGATLPSGGTDQTVIALQSAPIASIRAVEGADEQATLIKRFGLTELPSLPPVKSDHVGRRAKVPADQSKRCPKLEPVFMAYGLYPVKTWSYIAWRESGCNAKAQNAKWDANGNMTYALNKNRSYDTGLLQINSSWRSVTAKVCGEQAVDNRMQGLKKLDCNLRVARYIMDNSQGGLSNWNM
jgi:hypothetical protein